MFFTCYVVNRLTLPCFHARTLWWSGAVIFRPQLNISTLVSCDCLEYGPSKFVASTFWRFLLVVHSNRVIYPVSYWLRSWFLAVYWLASGESVFVHGLRVCSVDFVQLLTLLKILLRTPRRGRRKGFEYSEVPGTYLLVCQTTSDTIPKDNHQNTTLAEMFGCGEPSNP